MRMTLLDMTQEILSDMDSDSVNSIDDTFESEQVAQIIKSTYYSIISSRDWDHLKQPIQLTPSADTALPTHMFLDDNVSRLVFINYNCAKPNDNRKYYKAMRYVSPDEFLQMTNAQNNTDASVDVILDPTGVELLIRNDRNPTYYTSFDDKTLIFNAYDSAVEVTLQNSKVQAQGYVEPSWLSEDSFVPDLPNEAFVALVEEAKSRAMFRLKQMEDAKAEQESRRQQRWLSRNQWRVKGGIRYPSYGRKSNKTRRDPTFDRYNE